MNLLQSYKPVLIGSFPIDIAGVRSDIDIACEAPDLIEFENKMRTVFSEHSKFVLKKVMRQNRPAVLARFEMAGRKFEIFGQSLAVDEQQGFRHLLVEDRLLSLGGPVVKEAVLRSKAQGIKTEPAFADVLRIEGDPYDQLLELSHRNEAFLRKNVLAKAWRVRRAKASDALGITRVRHATWRSTYAEIIPHEILASLNIDEEMKKRTDQLKAPAPKSGAWVADLGTDDVVGFSMFGAIRQAVAAIEAEVYAIYVLKEFQGLGIGTELLRKSFASLREQGFNSAVVWVLQENSSKNFYENLGGKKIGSRKAMIGKELVEDSYAWENLKAGLMEQKRTNEVSWD